MLRGLLRRSVLLFFFPALLAACASHSSEIEPQPAPTVTHLPDACASHPTFAAAQAGAQGQLGAMGGEPLVPSRATDIPAMTAASLLGRADLYEREVASIVRSGDGIAQTLTSFELTVDFATEALLFVSYWPTESTMTLRREGDTIHVYVARAKACFDEAAAANVAQLDQKVFVAVIPTDVASVEMHAVQEEYAPVFPQSDGACTREGTVFAGGGDPGLLEGSPNLFFVEGFSAMTGNIFQARSTDGTSWSPSEWSMDDLLTFEGRGPYADVYSPTALRIASELYVYAAVLPSPGASSLRIGRFASQGGARFGAEEVVLAPASSGWDDRAVGGPSLVERDGVLAMYYAGSTRGSTHYRVGRATSSDQGKTFVRRAEGPVVGPSSFAYPVSSVADPEVRVVGEHLEMWCTVALSGGNPNAALIAAIAHLTSPDGVAWTADELPLVLPSGEAEKGGVFGPATLVRDDVVKVFATAVNASHEPVVERFSCPKR
jgi:predicted GH43/DUF377 family glycosyl hydrolase